ncbi:hypothetical protein ONS95_010612 [Cadophora gregata]|uniref:uncharacterized protein n=1 Tax=Cadophora gregata TaxID=51156 RepID=UPI0026DCE07D|nr:uncharacterized protein ONS95_010612 [Cadophora gregata]KAK0122371.1 hypothetical protein ONS95_010612 [Cadophora gregata]KAK0127850.1 hypothetical protein ONS96_007351 [Cadophora gregata f. sp. sojae]
MAVTMVNLQEVPQQSGVVRTVNETVEADEVKNPTPVTNLTEAIFLPFKSFRPVPLSSEAPLTPAQKLAKIIENVETQQALVKSKMVYLTEKRVNEVITNAEAELSDMGEGTFTDDEPGEVEARRERRVQAESLMEFMGRPAKKGAKKGDFIRRGSPSFAKQMDTPQLTSHIRHTYMVRKEASSKIRSIIMDSTAQLEAYHKLTSSTLKFYKQAQSRHTSTSDSSPLPSPIQKASGNVNISPPRASTVQNLASPRQKNAATLASPIRKGSGNLNISPEQSSPVPKLGSLGKKNAKKALPAAKQGI